MDTPHPVPRPPTLLEAIVPVASLIVLVGLSFYVFGDAGAIWSPEISSRPPLMA